jgi:hypothetical protein
MALPLTLCLFFPLWTCSLNTNDPDCHDYFQLGESFLLIKQGILTGKKKKRKKERKEKEMNHLKYSQTLRLWQ